GQCRPVDGPGGAGLARPLPHGLALHGGVRGVRALGAHDGLRPPRGRHRRSHPSRTRPALHAVARRGHGTRPAHDLRAGPRRLRPARGPRGALRSPVGPRLSRSPYSALCAGGPGARRHGHLARDGLHAAREDGRPRASRRGPRALRPRRLLRGPGHALRDGARRLARAGPAHRQREAAGGGLRHRQLWRSGAGGAVRAAWQEPTVRSVLVITVLMNVLLFPYQHMLAVFSRDVLRAGPEWLGALVAAEGLGSLLGALVIASRRGFVAHRRLFVSAVLI